jgi:hypothetical protein
MNKSITKNVRYDKFNNFCVNNKGKDLTDTPLRDKSKQGLNDCLASCAKNHEKCSAVEYYEKGRGEYKCYQILMGLSDENKAAKGSSKPRYMDATCYVRS